MAVAARKTNALPSRERERAVSTFEANFRDMTLRGRVYAGVVDAAKMLSAVGNAAMEPMAAAVNEKLRRAVDSLARG